MEPIDVLREFVADVQAAVGPNQTNGVPVGGIDEDELDWPDLLITYRNAVQAVELADRE